MRPYPAVFFTHIPRSGGTSLIRSLVGSVPAERRYPSDKYDDVLNAKMSVRYLLGLPRSRLEQVDFFSPHMPHAVTELLGLDLFTVTLIRDPVARVRSSLDSIAQDDDSGEDPLARAYAESAWADGWILDNQLVYYLGTSTEQLQRISALDVESNGPAAIAELLGDPADLVERACRTLESIDLVALTEQLAELIPLLEEKLGVAPGTVAANVHHNKGAGRPLSPSLRRRIEDRCAADRAVYDFAVDLISRRRAEQAGSTVKFGA